MYTHKRQAGTDYRYTRLEGQAQNKENENVHYNPNGKGKEAKKHQLGKCQKEQWSG